MIFCEGSDRLQTFLLPGLKERFAAKKEGLSTGLCVYAQFLCG